MSEAREPAVGAAVLEDGVGSEGALLAQLFTWAGGVWLAFALLFIVVYAVMRSPASLIFGLMTGALWLAARIGRRWALEGRIQPALFLVSLPLWLVSILLGARGSYTLGPAALFAVWPMVLGVSYSTRDAQRRTLLISAAVFAVAATLSTVDNLLPSTLSDVAMARMSLSALVAALGLICLSLWHSGSRMRDALLEARDKNRALEESERTLELKVNERTAELEGINVVSRTVNATLDFDRVVQAINDSLRSVFAFDQMGIFLLDETGRRLRLDRQTGDDFPAELGERLRSEGIPVAESESAMVASIREGRAVFLADVDPSRVQSFSPTDRAIYEANPMRSLLLCPLEIQGEMRGCIFFTSLVEPFQLEPSEIDTIQRYVTPLGAAMQNARLFAEAEASRAAAQEANQTKSQFLANMSHELRTPLNAIIGYSEMLQEEAEDDGNEDYVPDLAKIQSSGRHLLELINGVLDLSKIESGKMEVFLEDFDVAELVKGVEGTIQPLVRKNENQLEVNDLEGVGAMRSDVTKLRQMLFNLLSNASKFTQGGRIGLEVERARVGSDDWLHFRVSDSGIGMDAQQLEKVFEEFSQADASTTRQYGGTGLGLPITKKFCEMLGGSIVATSEPGAGSTFEIHLPALAPSPEAEAPTARSSEDAASSEVAPEGARTVLAIDDDEAARDLIRRFLAAEGYRVLTAADGTEGLRLAREHSPDLITLDVIMPDVDGWTVLERLKADAELEKIPVILLTMTDERNLGFALGASQYLTKPIDRERLAEALRLHQGDAHSAPALIVDDDADAREVLRRGLERAGWAVLEADNGRVGLERLAEAMPGLILLDLMMPEMDGFEFVAELRRHETWRSIPVVVITAKELTADDRDRLEGDIVRVLQKGAFSRDDLLAEVKRLAQSTAV
jgi:signal transduction histidine kinase/DNA-binding response OmpR family regulator